MKEQLTKETIKCPHCGGQQTCVYPSGTDQRYYKILCVYPGCRMSFILKDRVLVEVHFNPFPSKTIL